MVLVDESGTPVRDALLWNDNRSAPQAAALIDELGGPQAWADATGVRPGRELHRHQAALGRRPRARRRRSARRACCSPTTGSPTSCAAVRASRRRTAATRRGTGYWSAAEDAYRPDLLRAAFGRDLAVPRVAGPREAVGETPERDRARARHRRQHGRRAGPRPRARRRGGLAGHERHGVRGLRPADRRPVRHRGRLRRRHRPLPPARLHAERRAGDRRGAAAWRVPGSTDLDRLALSVDDTEGLVLLPFLDGERTPALPDATGLLHGLTRHNATPAHLVRASVEGMLCGLADAVAPLEAVRRDPASHRADRRCGALGRRTTDRGGPVRAAGRRTRAGGVRRPRRRPAGGLDAGAGRRAAALEAGRRPSSSPTTPSADYYAPGPCGVLLGARWRPAAAPRLTQGPGQARSLT